MSIISEKVTAFKNKLAIKLPAYNIVIGGENGCDGFVAPYIQLVYGWNMIDDGTAKLAKKMNARITILIGKEFVDSNDPGGVIIAGELENDIEAILALSVEVPTQEFRVINSMNNGNDAKETEFDIII